MDTYYIENRSLWLDIKIRVMTRMHKIKGCKFLYDNEKQVC